MPVVIKDKTKWYVCPLHRAVSVLKSLSAVKQVADAVSNMWPERSPHFIGDALYAWENNHRLPCIDSLIGQKLRNIGDEQYSGTE